MSSTETLDSGTAAAIRAALAAATAGRLAEACAIGDSALANGSSAAALHAMLGALRCRAGEMEAGVRHLDAASKERPADPIIARNLAMALADLGRPREALDAIPDALTHGASASELAKLRGQVAQAAEEYEQAISSYERVLAHQPEDWEAWNNLGNARRGAGDLDGALNALRRAEKLNPGSGPIALNLALTSGWAGQLEEAEQRLRDVADRFPDDSSALRELHALLKEQDREGEALDAITAAVSRAPRDTELLLALARQRVLMLDHRGAEAAYQNVMSIDPANALANLGLAIIYELTNQTLRLAQSIDEAVQRGAGRDVISFIRALNARRERRFAEGLAALQQVPDTLETARRAHLEGQLLDGLGRYDAAFEAFAKMNAIKREDPSQPERRGAVYRNAVRREMAAVSTDWFDGWRDEAKPYGGPTPVFLVGFPRSGTTLLDTILLSHPSIEILEEEPALKDATALLPETSELPQAGEDLIAAARARYFQIAGRHTPLRPDSLLVDKNPLHMNKIPAIRRLFPSARIILALRHPCDVILSCVSTNFASNAGMSSFLHLDSAAELYDLSFSCFTQACSVIGPPVHRVVYERIVEDRERELRGLFDFLMLEWDEAVLDHQSTARGREHIKTASYAQVVEPIYSRSAGRWERYRKHLEPILPILEPWIDRLGYTA